MGLCPGAEKSADIQIWGGEGMQTNGNNGD